MVRLVVRVSTRMEDNGILRGPGTVCNAESMGALDGCDGILEVIGDVRVILGSFLEVSCSSADC